MLILGLVSNRSSYWGGFLLESSLKSKEVIAELIEAFGNYNSKLKPIVEERLINAHEVHGYEGIITETAKLLTQTRLPSDIASEVVSSITVIALVPRHQAAILGLFASIAYREKNYADCVEMCKQALAKDKSPAKVLLSMAMPAAWYVGDRMSLIDFAEVASEGGVTGPFIAFVAAYLDNQYELMQYIPYSEEFCQTFWSSSLFDKTKMAMFRMAMESKRFSMGEFQEIEELGVNLAEMATRRY